jgi:predicted ATPase/DNA-binding XRE family transcriptional regulator
MPATQAMTFAQLLRHFRIAAGLTQEQLADRAHLSKRGIADLERGQRQAPRKETVALLAEALGLSADERDRFEAVIHRHRTPLPHHFHTLPAPLTPLIGREREEAAAVHLLRRADVRLLTLVGAPGIGKTRLALQIGPALEDQFADGEFLIALAPLRDPALVLTAIAQAVGLREGGGQPVAEHLQAYLRTRQALLILDNFEQVVAAGSQIVDLLSACPRVKALVTSRIPLHVRGEHELSVPPLALPDPHRLPPAEELSQFAAVGLFVQRARAVRPTFAVAPTNVATVVAICRRLDGLPLAIELAAAWTKVVSAEALLVRLDHSLAWLTAGASDLPERQQTLRGAIQWSHDLLDAGEQALFPRLAVFAGGWALEAAEAVCVQERIPEHQVARTLASLVDKSLVQYVEASGHEPRFALLETLREFGLERLTASGEAESWRRRHAEYYTTQAELAATRLLGPEQMPAAAWLLAEMDNLRAALRWAQEHGETAIGLRAAVALWRIWYSSGPLTEGRTWLEGLLALDASAGEHSAAPVTRAQALLAAASLARVQGDFGSATARATDSLDLYRRLGDLSGAADALNQLAAVVQDQGDAARAIALLEECLSLRRNVGDAWGAGMALTNLGAAVLSLGDSSRARALQEESLAEFHRSGERIGVALALKNLGDVAREQGAYAQAEAHYRESLIRYWAIGRDAGLLSINTLGVCWCLEGLANVARTQGHPADAARLFAIAAALRDAAGTPVEPSSRATYEREVAAVRVALGEAAFATAWAVGRSTSLEQAIAELEAE